MIALWHFHYVKLMALCAVGPHRPLSLLNGVPFDNYLYSNSLLYGANIASVVKKFLKKV